MNKPETSAAPASDVRHLSLDVMRGIAVMGILAMNIAGFALPQVDYSTPAGPMSDDAAGRLSWLAAYLLFDGKMMGLFTMLFGASALLVIDRAEARGRDAGRVHYARIGWLILFGIMHLLLIWDGDILFYYGLCGLFLFAARRAAPYKLLMAGIALLLVSYLFSLYLAGAVLGAEPGSALTRDFAYSASAYDAQVALYRSGYAAILDYRIGEFGVHLLNALELVPRLLGAMLVGAALYRSGFLTGQWSARAYLLTAMACLSVGGAAQVALAIWAFESGFAPTAMFCVSYALPAPFQLAMAVGYGALIVLMAAAGDSEGKNRSRTMRGLANVGRMSFSNYIGTSIAMTTIFYGYGLGLFGQVDRAALWLFVIGGWAAMLLLSNLWLTRFSQGPLEYLWRRLAGGARMGQASIG